MASKDANVWAASADLAGQSFGLDLSNGMISLCPYGPVYKVRGLGRWWVLKQTGYPRSTAAAIARWLEELHEKGVKVVCPSAEFKPNPRRLSNEDKSSWVIYPFIDGSKYQGKPYEIERSGMLLGQIHFFGKSYGFEMLTPDAITPPSQAQIDYSLSAMKDKIGGTGNPSFYNDEECRRKAKKILVMADKVVIGGALPRVACSWDFKASNLVFNSDEYPVLVDPDHGGRIPRIYDLACALVLFHCDHEPGPRRIWTKSEWEIFLNGYKKSIVLTDLEKAAWQAALCVAWLVEGLWLLANFDEGWKDQNEAMFMRDLYDFDPAKYEL